MPAMEEIAVMSNKFSIVLVSSVHGELGRLMATSRPQAFRLAEQVLHDRAESEARLDPAPMHNEIVSVQIAGDDG
jgi:hypothetical protein